MSRPITLFTGQWADIPLTALLPKVKAMGFDGVELCCWGDHFDVVKALADPDYVQSRWDLLEANDLGCWTISTHLVGQAVCDLIDARHESILPPEIWGDGEPEGVRKRAAQRMIDTAKACRKFVDAGKEYMATKRAGSGKAVVNGFTGSSIWGALYAFPPTNQAYLQRGFDDFAERWIPILDAFEVEDVDFGLEVHPTEIAFDGASMKRAIEAVKGHKRFRIKYDPSHLGYQHVDYVKFIRDFADRIADVHMKDVQWGKGDGSVGVFGGHTDFCDARRYWDFRSVGRGNIDFEAIIVALNDIGYTGQLGIEWEDGRMDRFHGAKESCEFVRRLDFPPSKVAFDAAFDNQAQEAPAA